MLDDQPVQSTSSFQQQEAPRADKITKARDKGANKGAKKAAKGKGREVRDEPEELNKLAEHYVSTVKMSRWCSHAVGMRACRVTEE